MSAVVADAHYEDPALAALYDLDSPWSEDRDFFLALAGQTPLRILDLGCGTGLLATAYAARGHRVMGLDPAAAMLDVARARRHGETVRWAQGTAEAFPFESTFDLIVMTGHAFQALLDDGAMAAVFRSVAGCLLPEGRFCFETRNPALAWAERWDYERIVLHGGESVRLTRRFLAWDEDRMVFDLGYHWNGQAQVARSVIRFPPRAGIETHLAAAGLSVKSLAGDWRGGAFDASASEEMIFTVSHTA